MAAPNKHGRPGAAWRVALVCPTPPREGGGNRTTAHRWARLLRELGHRVRIVTPEQAPPAADLLIALHARRSAGAAAAFRALWPERGLVVALTGTDLYADLPGDAGAERAIHIADRLVLLQPLALRRLPPALRPKARVIYQSATPPPRRTRRAPAGSRTGRILPICVLSHIRPVKDPLCAALAARLLPPTSRIHVFHAGRIIDPGLADAVARERAANPRYRWLGELSPGRARALLARSVALVNSSRLEGGANVVGEAVVAGVPVLASRIDGNVGLLGNDYPGYFPVGDTQALAALFTRVESDPAFVRTLRAHARLRARLFRPERERAAWQALLEELEAAGRLPARRA